MIPWHRLRTLIRQPRKVASNYYQQFRHWLRELRLDRELHALRIHLWFYRKVRRRRVIVLVRHGGIGDIICTFPAVQALRAEKPDAYLVYAVWPEFRAVVEMGGVADAIVALRPREYQARFRPGDYDELYTLQLMEETGKEGEALHLTEDFARTLSVRPRSMQPRLTVPDALREKMRAHVNEVRQGDGCVVGVHVGPSWPVREWGAPQWAELARLLKTMNCALIQLGADIDTTRGRVCADRVPAAIDWINRFSLPETCGVIEALDLFIGIDSGLLHIAGAVGTPCVGLFGAINPALRLPPETASAAVTSHVPCLGCQHRTPRLHWQTGCPYDIACMKELKPADVAAAVTRLFAALN